MNSSINKIKEGIFKGIGHGIGFVLIVGISGLAYAAFTWVAQTDVQTGHTLTAAGWNDMLNNQNYLKQEVEGIVVPDITGKLNKSGDTMAGELAMGTNKITGLGTPVANTDAVTKAYADSVGATGEGQYQVSCAYDASAGRNYCVRINTITGTTECKLRYQIHNNSYHWESCVNSAPW